MKDVVHKRINNPPHNCSNGKIHILEISKVLLGVSRSSVGLSQPVDLEQSQGHVNEAIPSKSSTEWCVLQIK